MDDRDRINEYRQLIKERLRNIPDSVKSGSYTKAAAFKQVATKANSLALSSKPSLQALISAYSRLNAYY